MNKNRREILVAAINLIEYIKDDVVNISEAESEAFDNLPEPIRDSIRGQDMSQNVSDLDEVYDTLDSAVDLLNAILDR